MLDIRELLNARIRVAQAYELAKDCCVGITTRIALERRQRRGILGDGICPGSWRLRRSGKGAGGKDEGKIQGREG